MPKRGCEHFVPSIGDLPQKYPQRLHEKAPALVTGAELPAMTDALKLSRCQKGQQRSGTSQPAHLLCIGLAR